MSESPENAQLMYNAVEKLTQKMLGKMGFTKGQEVSWYDSSSGGEQMNFWIHGIELEVSEIGSTTGLNYSVSLEHLPLAELLNKCHENTDEPIAVGTDLSFDALETTSDYRIRPRKLTKRGTVVGIKVVVYDNRLRHSSFDPQFLKTVKSSIGGFKRKTNKKTRKNRRRNSRRN